MENTPFFAKELKKLATLNFTYFLGHGNRNIRDCQRSCYMGHESVSMKEIQMLCNSFRLEQNIVLMRMEHLIDNYEEVVWANTDTVRVKDAGWKMNSDRTSDQAIAYIRDFDPNENRRIIHKEMLKLFEARWLKNLFETVMERVKASPLTKPEYVIILNNFWSDERIKPYDYQKNLHIGKTTYNERRKEAILLFGIVLWGRVIPGLSQKGLQVAESFNPDTME